MLTFSSCIQHVQSSYIHLHKAISPDSASLVPYSEVVAGQWRMPTVDHCFCQLWPISGNFDNGAPLMNWWATRGSTSGHHLPTSFITGKLKSHNKSQLSYSKTFRSILHQYNGVLQPILHNKYAKMKILKIFTNQRFYNKFVNNSFLIQQALLHKEAM